MSILKTLLALIVTSWVIGCRDRLVTQAVSPCEQAALDHCAAMGLGKVRLCYLTFAKNCTQEIKAESQKECLKIVGSSSSEAECVLHWP